MIVKSGKLDFHKALPGVLLRLLLACCFSILITRLSLDFAKLDFMFGPQTAAATIVIIIAALFTWTWQSALAITSIGGAAAVFGWLSGYFSSDEFHNLIENTSFWLVEAFYWLISQPNYFPESTKPILAIVIGILVSAACFWLVAKTTQPMLMLISVIVLVIARQSIGISTSLWLLSACLLVTLTGFAVKQTGWSRKLKKQLILIQPAIARQAAIIAVAAITTAALLTAIVPVSYITSLGRLVRAKNLAEGLLILNSVSGAEKNTGFDYAGYYPLNDRLGGPVILSSDPVLLVNSGISPLLLKGSVSDKYTGFGWHRLPTSGEYEYGNTLWLEYFRHVYDLDLPDQEFMETLPEDQDSGLISREAEYEISHLINGLRSVYHEGKPQVINMVNDGLLNILPSTANDSLIIQLKTDENLYFNEGGVLYRKTSIPKSQNYKISANILEIDEYKFAEWYKKASQKQNDNRTINPDEVLKANRADSIYLQLPELPEYKYGGEIDLLTQSIIKEYNNSYDKAIAIRNFLRSTNSYSLDVELPPENKEFVSWFLEQGEGYCVYFATALTMMCRSAGIPARYVEGYWVPPVQISEDSNSYDSNERIITGQQAHAWSEIYLENIGWITMDATPGGGEAATQVFENEELETEITTTEITTNQTGNETEPNTSDNQSAVSQPKNGDKQGKSNLDEKLIIILPVLLLLALATLWYVYKIRNYRKRSNELWWLNRTNDAAHRIRIILPEIKALLRWNGFSWPDNQSWSSFAKTVTADLMFNSEWQSAAASIEKSIYSNNILTEDDWRPVWKSYLDLIRITENKKPKLYWRILLVINS